MALGEFAREVRAGENKRILLVLDQAGWHTSDEVEVPEGRLWPLTNEAIANRLFEEISEVEDALVERCVQLLDQAGTIKELTNYHWWPQAA